jgi:hypothetical protein
MEAMLENRKFLKKRKTNVWRRGQKMLLWSFRQKANWRTGKSLSDTWQQYQIHFQILQKATLHGLEINDERNVAYISISSNPQ